MDRFVINDDIKSKLKQWLLFGHAEQWVEMITASKQLGIIGEKSINWEAIFEEIEGM